MHTRRGNEDISTRIKKFPDLANGLMRVLRQGFAGGSGECRETFKTHATRSRACSSNSGELQLQQVFESGTG
jgi:hypothetical protein